MVIHQLGYFLIFLLLLFSLRILFFLHLSLIFDFIDFNLDLTLTLRIATTMASGGSKHGLKKAIEDWVGRV